MRRIVIGFDGSDRGRDALAVGRALAELVDRAGAEAVEVAVALVYPVASFGASGQRTLDDERRRQAHATLEQARESWPELPLGAFRLVQAGSPAAGLHQLALDREAGAIVVGASHHGATGRVFPGSATEQTLHGSPCAVLVAPPGYAGAARPLRRIGVAYDAAPEARSALQAARRLVRGRDDVVLVVVDVADTTQPFAIPYGYPNYVVDLQAIADDQLQEAHKALGDVAHVELDRRDGDPVHELLQASRELDLLVLGSRGHGPLKRLLLGSVSTHVVRGAACPLLLLPHGSATPSDAVPFAVGTGARA